jgi:hypothetical protein
MVAAEPLISAWLDLQQWAKTNTPQAANFLVPPLPEGFRVFSERSIWVDYKDGHAMYSSPGSAPEWRRRLEAIGIWLTVEHFSWQRMIRQYKEQSWERLVTTARDHHIHYVIQCVCRRAVSRPCRVREREILRV